MAQTFVVRAWAPDFATSHQLHCGTGSKAATMRQALRLGWELIGGIAGAYARIEGSKGNVAAELETTWKGELSDPCICVKLRGTGLPYQSWRGTPLNPNGPIFAGVFAV